MVSTWCPRAVRPFRSLRLCAFSQTRTGHKRERLSSRHQQPEYIKFGHQPFALHPFLSMLNSHANMRRSSRYAGCLIAGVTVAAACCSPFCRSVVLARLGHFTVSDLINNFVRLPICTIACTTVHVKHLYATVDRGHVLPPPPPATERAVVTTTPFQPQAGHMLHSPCTACWTFPCTSNPPILTHILCTCVIPSAASRRPYRPPQIHVKLKALVDKNRTA